MFYNVPCEQLADVRLGEIKTHSFVEKEVRLLRYVQNRQAVDIEKAVMDFSVYENDISERHIRIPKLQQLYERKIEMLRVFQKGMDIWKDYKRSKGGQRL